VKRISEGQCAIFGKEPSDCQMTSMALWRHRVHNERSGLSKTDGRSTGDTWSSAMAHDSADAWNTMNWFPARGGSAYAQSSHKRLSEMKCARDFNARVASTAGQGQAAAPLQVETSRSFDGAGQTWLRGYLDNSASLEASGPLVERDGFGRPFLPSCGDLQHFPPLSSPLLSATRGSRAESKQTFKPTRSNAARSSKTAAVGLAWRYT